VLGKCQTNLVNDTHIWQNLSQFKARLKSQNVGEIECQIFHR